MNTITTSLTDQKLHPESARLRCKQLQRDNDGCYPTARPRGVGNIVIIGNAAGNIYRVTSLSVLDSASQAPIIALTALVYRGLSPTVSVIPLGTWIFPLHRGRMPFSSLTTPNGSLEALALGAFFRLVAAISNT